MEKYDNDPSVPDDSVHTSCCAKTEAGSNPNTDDVSDHELHCIKTESDIDTYMTDFNNPTSDTKAGEATIGLDTNSSLMCIKSEHQDDARMQCDAHNVLQWKAEQTVIDRTGIVYMFNHNDLSSLQMCYDNQTQIDDTHNTSLKVVSLKHDHTYCKDDHIHPSMSPLNATDGYEFRDTGDKRYKCIHCVKSFTRLDSLDCHTRLHSGDKPYKCEQCVKSFANKGSLVTHIRVHSGEKPYKCEQCMKSFSQKSSLNTHMRVHSGVKPYKCEQCVKSFSNTSSLTAHIRAHSGVKPYKCEQCVKSFSHKSSLTTHIRVHSGDEPNM
jgi:uncharacterized Zn-finger protein